MSKLQFDEKTHTYKVDGVKYASVTTVVKKWFQPFNAPVQAARYAAKHGKTAKHWMKEWQKTAVFGTRIHSFAEKFLKERVFPKTSDQRERRFQEHIGRFVEKEIWGGFEVVFIEHKTFSEKHHLAGTVDLVLRDTESNGLLLADWKTNKQIRQCNTWAAGFKELSHLDDCNYVHYSLQLNLYRALLNIEFPNSGYDTATMALLHLTELKGVNIYKVFPMETEVASILKELEC